MGYDNLQSLTFSLFFTRKKRQKCQPLSGIQRYLLLYYGKYSITSSKIASYPQRYTELSQCLNYFRCYRRCSDNTGVIPFPILFFCSLSLDEKYMKSCKMNGDSYYPVSPQQVDIYYFLFHMTYMYLTNKT